MMVNRLEEREFSPAFLQNMYRSPKTVSTYEESPCSYCEGMNGKDHQEQQTQIKPAGDPHFFRPASGS